MEVGWAYTQYTTPCMLSFTPSKTGYYMLKVTANTDMSFIVYYLSKNSKTYFESENYVSYSTNTYKLEKRILLQKNQEYFFYMNDTKGPYIFNISEVSTQS